ncbi:MAG: protein-disulfide reductase DsbD family protein [Roseovarius sp.]|nr:protein-disulfide reductase DsbD family protein [Roseovarius sp.]
MKWTTFLGAILAVLAPAVLAGPLDDAVEARLLPGWRAPDGRHMAAIEVTLAKGWKTYWRAPGDAGIPPQFDWRGSDNLAGVEITWPTPDVMSQDGMQVIGYSGRVILPLAILPKRQGRDVQLSGSIDIGVCKDVCLPLNVSLEQVLHSDVTKPTPSIAAAMADRPYSSSEANVGRVRCRFAPTLEGLQLTTEVDLPHIGGGEVMIIETGNPEVWVAQGKTSRNGKRLSTVSELVHVEGRAFSVNRSGLRITVIGASHAVDIQGCPAG